MIHNDTRSITKQLERAIGVKDRRAYRVHPDTTPVWRPVSLSDNEEIGARLMLTRCEPGTARGPGAASGCTPIYWWRS